MSETTAAVETKTYESKVTAVTDRVAPWMGMAPDCQALDLANLTTHEVAEKCNLLGWNLRLEDTPSVGICTFNQFDVVIDSPAFGGRPETIGRVGERYNPFTNEELVDLADSILPHGAHWEAMGTRSHRSSVFMAAKLDEDMYLGGEDKIERYLLLSTSHDGKSPVTAAIIPMRMRCTNSLTFGLKNALRSFKVRHGKSVASKSAEAGRVLALTENYFQHFNEEMEKLVSTTISEQKAINLIKRAHPVNNEESKAAQTRNERLVDTIWDIYKSDTIGDFYGTKWGLLNAMEERLDWARTSRTGEIENIFAASAGFSDPIVKEKTRLFELVKAAR